MLSSVSVANSIAQAALSTASAQASLLRDNQSQLGALGQLALIEYCEAHTVNYYYILLVLFLSPQLIICLLPIESTYFY